MYTACMPHIQVREVPDKIHAELVRRAEGAGMSLQQFLSEKLTTIATTPSLHDVIDRIERRDKGDLSTENALDVLDVERARR